METFSYFIFINIENAPDFNTFLLKVKQMPMDCLALTNSRQLSKNNLSGRIIGLQPRKTTYNLQSMDKKRYFCQEQFSSQSQQACVAWVFPSLCLLLDSTAVH